MKTINSHPLHFYAVYGLLAGLYEQTGLSASEAENKAAEMLAECHPAKVKANVLRDCEE